MSLFACLLPDAMFLIAFITEMTQKQHLTRQKQLLNKTLGLDSDIGLANVGDELFKEEDLIIQQQSSVQTSAPQASDDVIVLSITLLIIKLRHTVISSLLLRANVLHCHCQVCCMSCAVN